MTNYNRVNFKYQERVLHSSPIPLVISPLAWDILAQKGHLQERGGLFFVGDVLVIKEEYQPTK